MNRREIVKGGLTLAAVQAVAAVAKAQPMQTALHDLTAAQALRAMRDGSISAVEYLDGLLQQLERHQDWNLVSALDPDHVRAEARKIDDARARRSPLGPLAGLAVLVKDSIDTLGFPTAAGTEALRDNWPTADAPVIVALRRQGAVVLAKTNMHELAAGGTSTNMALGPVKNPYDPRRVPGGSSGGTAAAIAARCGPCGLGSDTAGSCRIPAALSGIVGMRPSLWDRSRKRYSDGGLVPLVRDLDTIGPMGRTVADVALIDAAIVGRPVVTGRSLQGVRFGIPRGAPLWAPLAPDVEVIVDRALRQLTVAGATLIEVDMQSIYQQASGVFWTLLEGGYKSDLADYVSRLPRPLKIEQVLDAIKSRDVRAHLREGVQANIDLAAVERARGEARAKLRRHYASLFDLHRLNAIIFPTEPLSAPLIRLDGDHPDDVILFDGKEESLGSLLIRNTLMASAIGAPGLSLPCGLTAAGLPVGLEVEGRLGHDDQVLAIGIAIEAELGVLPAPQSL